MTKCISRVRQDTIDLVELLWLVPTTVSIPELLERACFEAHYDITVRDLVGRGRDGRTSAVRQALMYILRQQRNMSLQEVGNVFHRDHSTVSYVIRKIRPEIGRKKIRIRSDTQQQKDLENIGDEVLLVGITAEDPQQQRYFLQTSSAIATGDITQRFDSYGSLVGGILVYCSNRAHYLRIVYEKDEKTCIPSAERGVLEGIVQMHNRLTRLEQQIARTAPQNPTPKECSMLE